MGDIKRPNRARFPRGAAALACLMIAGGILLLSGEWSKFDRYLLKMRAKGTKHESLVHLFDEASGLDPEVRSSASSVRAVQEIGAYPGEEAEQMLLALAARQPEVPFVDVQVQAVRELKMRADPKIPALLAALMRPQTLIDTRKAVAVALQSLPCDRTCATSLLQYLKKIDQGEQNIEDVDVFHYQSGLDEQVRAKIEAEQQEIYSMIYIVLSRQSKILIAVLSDEYGLGSEVPRDFAINFATRSQDRRICPELERSAKALGDDINSSSREIRRKLDQALTTLECSKQ